LVSVAGNAAFLGGRWGLYVVDVTNPASPHRIGSWGSDVIGVEARGNICCVTLGSPSQPTYLKFYVLDARNPASLVPLGSIDSCGGYDFHLEDSLAFLSGYYTGGHEFRILSIRDSVHPYSLGGCVTQGDGFGVWSNRATGMALVADNLRGLALMNIDNLSNPTYDRMLLAAAYSEDVVVQGDLAYIGNQGFGLKTVDVSNPALPFEVGSLDTGYGMSTYSVAVQDSFAFMVWSPNRPWLRSIDVTDPTSPQKAGGVNTFDFARDMVVRDSFLYLAEPYRFQIVNVARPREPVLVGSCNSQDGVYFGLAVQDALAYLISGAVQVIDVADPSSPTIIGSTAVGGHGIAVRDTLVYVPYGYDTLRVYSASNPQSLRLLGSAPLQTHTWDVALAESTAVVATFNGLEAFSLEDSAHPHWRAAISTPYGPRRVVYSAPYFYAAMWEAGVGIYDAGSLGLQEQTAAVAGRTQLVVSPNPARNECRLSLPATGTHDVRLRDVSGRVVDAAVIDRETDQRLSLDLSKLAAGVYFVEVKTDRRISSAKLVKQ
jgi:hypothetical protein